MSRRIGIAAVAVLGAVACGSPRTAARVGSTTSAPARPEPAAVALSTADSAARHSLRASEQLVVVTTANWTATAGTLQRFDRDRSSDAWRAVGSPVAVVVGRTGLAWGIPFDSAGRRLPAKHEGDGAAPAGVFPLDTAFGFSSREMSPAARLPYFPIRAESECVDDLRSVHYNTIVDRDRVPGVDWSSSEHMQRIIQYRLGITVGYNAPHPVAGRGSCIFLHVWAGPGTSTAGCTAMDEAALRELVSWLDVRRAPRLVQMPAAQYEARRERWGLP